MDTPISSHDGDRAGKTLTIPVRVTGGKVGFAYGKQMPGLADGARGALVVNVDSVVDRYVAKLLQSEQTVELLPVGALVLIAIRPLPGDADAGRAAYQKSIGLMKPGLLYFEVYVQDVLGLHLAGARQPRFVGGACEIPALDNRRAISLNQAFTFLSERYETDRESHVGNAFKSGMYFDGAVGEWRTLEAARGGLQASFEEYLTEQSNIKGARRKFVDPPTFAEWSAGKQLQASLPF